MNAAVVRYAGAGLIFLLSLYAGFASAESYRRRISRVEGVVALIEKIRREVDCFGTPLSEIIAGFDDGELQKCGFISLLAGGCYSGAAATLECGECEAVISRFFEGAGKMYREDVLKLCDSTLSELEDALASMKAECKSRQKVSRALGFLVGVSALIAVI